jgi:hypothetical protein
MKTQLLQDLQESGSTAPAAGEAVPTSAQARRKPVVLADETRTPLSLPPQTVPVPADDARTPSIQPPQPPAPPADDARTLPDGPRRPAVWHGPAAQRVDAGMPGQPLAPRAARRAPDPAARGVGVAIEAWADRVAQAGAAESRPAPPQQPAGVSAPEPLTMDVAAFFGRDERRGAGHSPAPPTQPASSGDSSLGHQITPAPRTAPIGSTPDAHGSAAAVPRRPHLDDVPAAGAGLEHVVSTVAPPVAASGIAGHGPPPVRPADSSVPGVPVHEHMPAARSDGDARPHVVALGGARDEQVRAAQLDDTTLLRAPADERVPAAQWHATPPASAPDARTEPMPQRVAAPFPAAVDTPLSPWRRLWKRRVVAWSAAGVLAAAVGGGAGWLYAGSRAESGPVAANTVPAAAARGAQAYVAREPATTVKALPTAPAPEPAQAPAPSAVAPIDAVKPPPPAEPKVKPSLPAPAPAVAPAASRSVATVDLDAPKRAARHAAAAARKRAAEKARREAMQDARPAKAEPSPRERREETLMQCRAHGYDERQCIRRGCAMTRYGFACRG